MLQIIGNGGAVHEQIPVTVVSVLLLQGTTALARKLLVIL